QKVLDFKLGLSPEEGKLVGKAWTNALEHEPDPGVRDGLAKTFIYDDDQDWQANRIGRLQTELATLAEDLKGKSETLKSDIQQVSDDIQSEMRAMSRAVHRSHNAHQAILQSGE